MAVHCVGPADLAGYLEVGDVGEHVVQDQLEFQAG